MRKEASKEVLDKEGSVAEVELSADDKASEVEVKLVDKEVILNEEGNVAKAEWAVDDENE
jgi:hypothetical protein